LLETDISATEEDMIKVVRTKKELKRFIYFVRDLYRDDPHYIYPLFFILTKELKQIVLQKKEYTALLSVDELDNIRGRLLYRMEYNPKSQKKVCYFSFFDAIDSEAVTNELFLHMEADMLSKGVYYSEGSFTPYDPDNRRGILVEGFDSDPVIFTSYNKPYIPKLLENFGYIKSRDTYSIKPVISEENEKRLKSFSNYFERRYQIDVNFIDFKNIDRDIRDIHQILSEADNEIIYQETPTIDLIRSVAENMKVFLDRRIIMIAREQDTSRPVGFFFCLLDFNQVFKKMKGKFRPLRMIMAKKKINRVRGMMQYVIPKYHGSGLIAYIYQKIYDQFKIMGITDFEGGTVMEENDRSKTTFDKFGGEIHNIYRIYGKDLTK